MGRRRYGGHRGGSENCPEDNHFGAARDQGRYAFLGGCNLRCNVAVMSSRKCMALLGLRCNSAARDAGRRSVGYALHAGQRTAVSLRYAQRCRSEAPTGRTGRRSRACRAVRVNGAARFAALRAARADQRSAFQAVPALLRNRRCTVRSPEASACRPEVGVPSRPRASSQSAMHRALAGGQRVPTRGRRSKPSPRFFAIGDAQCARRSQRVPTRGRPSKPSPRFFAVGDGSSAAGGRDAGLKTGAPCAPCPLTSPRGGAGGSRSR